MAVMIGFLLRGVVEEQYTAHIRIRSRNMQRNEAVQVALQGK
ncbi:hypothetical protein [Qipengyuania sp. JC766]